MKNLMSVFYLIVSVFSLAFFLYKVRIWRSGILFRSTLDDFCWDLAAVVLAAVWPISLPVYFIYHLICCYAKRAGRIGEHE